MIDEQTIRQVTANAFEFHLVRRPMLNRRTRLPDNLLISNLTPKELLKLYLQANHSQVEEIQDLLALADSIF
jgi:hypothetical protein